MSSAMQKQWKEITAAFRQRVTQLVPHMPQMSNTDLLTLIQAADAAHWLEVQTATHDAQVHERRAMFRREENFGG